MHELGLATSILDCVDQEDARYPGGHISKVGDLRAASQICPELGILRTDLITLQ
jgi:hypothetical protein